MAQPVKQCSVAEKARRLREEEWACIRQQGTLLAKP
jgi:hypothetical protein